MTAIDTTCVFCSHPAIKERTITTNEFAFAFPTNIPIVPGHTLICPIRCVATFEELNEWEWAAMMELRGKIRLVLMKAFGAQGFHYVWNEGQVAGQSVPHLHLHVVPRWVGDTGITEYEPRKFLYRPGSREPTPEEELRMVSIKIWAALQNL
jgi:diadenosine tetraphosphate (Ap4A) HIT family hydrolase